MDDIIIKFLRAYKKLDELCKQVLGSSRGISEYIDQMQNEGEDCLKIPNWYNDLKELKRLRWMRNRLVHDADSFDVLTITREDILYLKEFRSRILECEDPFALLRNSQKTIKRSNSRTKNGETEFVDDGVFEEFDDMKPQKFLAFKVFFVGIVILILILFIKFFFS